MNMKYLAIVLIGIMVLGCVEQPSTAKVEFVSGEGDCGSEVLPKMQELGDTMAFKGAIEAGNPCHAAIHEVETSGNTTKIMIRAEELKVGPCVQCIGSIEWEANVTGASDVEIYYGEEKVYPKAGFCGWSTNATCSDDMDCVRGGCSQQVCQSTDEEPVITTCEYRECYDDESYGVDCLCVGGKCQWTSQ
jgi:eight-cysteine-cluster-containing protein